MHENEHLHGIDVERPAAPSPAVEDEMPEGEEAPPPGVRFMALLRWALILGMTIFAAGVLASHFGLLQAAAVTQSTTYHCPMHPTYTSDRPGECPICGMNLVEVAADATAAARQVAEAAPAGAAHAGAYACPMHPEETSTEPGECARCGMDLERVEGKDGKSLYQCPMHPEVTSEDAAERCPKCNMKLEPAEKSAAEAGHTAAEHAAAVAGATAGHAEHAVPGLAAVHIPTERVQRIGVKTASVARKPLSRSLDLVGYVVPDESRLAHVHTRLAGWLEHVHVAETGQKVKKGDPLFTLFSRELYQAEREFLLTRKNTGGGAVAQGTMAEVANAARRRLELLDVPADEIARLEKGGVPQEALLFRSPLSGYILQKGALAGKYVTPGDELYVVSDLSHVWVLAEVYEQHLASVGVGQKASLTVDAHPGKTFEGKVGFVYPTLSPRTRTLRVRLEFDNAALALRPGMFGKVRLQLAGRTVLSAPEEAVVDAGQHSYAFVARGDGHFEPRLVTTGARADGHVEILSGLDEGEQIVTSAGFFVDSESRLRAAIAGMGAPPAHTAH